MVTEIIASAVAENLGESFASTGQMRHHQVVADEPPEFGGKDLGPMPGEYLCLALATCTAITLRMYAQRKSWPVEQIRVKVDLVKGASMPSGNNTFTCSVAVQGDLQPEQQERLLQIAKACPVHRLLAKASDIQTALV